MSCKELAEEIAKLGFPKTQEAHLSIWENEKSVPSGDKLEALRLALKLSSVDYFYQEQLRD